MRSVGIDLGTTFSTVSVFNEKLGRPEAISIKGSSLIPSVLCFDKSGGVVFGNEAKESYSNGNLRAVAFYKREMGNPNYAFPIDDKEYSAEDLSAIFLKEVKKEVEKEIGKVDGAVITVPAYFNEFQRDATKKAGEKAGFKVHKIINEPTAAMLAYSLEKAEAGKRYMVYDLGGGTFDVTIAEINERGGIKCIGTSGDHQLGGKNWDDAIARYIAAMFTRDTGLDICENVEDFYSLLVKCEEAKKQLTSSPVAHITVHCGIASKSYDLSLEKFEDLTSQNMERTQMLCNELLSDIKLSWSNIDGVILVGGSTRMKCVSKFVTKMCQKQPVTGIDVDLAVSYGAAMQALSFEKEVPEFNLGEAKKGVKIFNYTLPSYIVDVTAHTLGVVAIDSTGTKYINKKMIGKNSNIPITTYDKFIAHQLETELYITQGESDIPYKCAILSKYVISGYKLDSNHQAIISIEYTYDENGMVVVGSKDVATNRRLNAVKEQVCNDLDWLTQSPNCQTNASGGGEAMNVMLAVDCSGSMVGKPFEKAIDAILNFAKELKGKAHLGLELFANRNQVVVRPTASYEDFVQEVKKITYTSTNVGIGNLTDPFATCQAEFLGSSGRNIIIVLTDGRWCHEDRALKKSKECKEKGTEIVAIGFAQAKKEFLEKLATMQEDGIFTDIKGLGSTFSKVAQVLVNRH